MKKILLPITSFLFSLYSFAQTNDCGNNPGFESGTTTGWDCRYGSYGTGPCPTMQNGVCPVFNSVTDSVGCKNNNGMNAFLNTGVDRHTIMDSTAYGTGFDPNTGIGPKCPVVPPGGGKYVFRLGDGVTGGTSTTPINYARAEAIKLSYSVASNPIFTYRYAAFLQDAGHWPEEQPRFEIIVRNASNSIIPCGYNKIAAGNINPYCPSVDTAKFHTGAANWHYTDWTTVSVDLSNYIGQPLTVEFRTSDCFPGQNGYDKQCPPSGCCTTTYNGVTCDCNGVCTGTLNCANQAGSHSAYAYIDAYCGPLSSISIVDSFTCGDTKATLCAPGGFNCYKWIDAPGTPTTQCVTINNPVQGTTYHVVLCGTIVSGCKTTDTLATTLSCTVGMNDLTSSDGNFITVSPNPFHNTTTVAINSKAQILNSKLSVFDIVGREVFSKMFSGNKTEIERRDLESGVYFVRVRSEERQWVGKVVVE